MVVPSRRQQERVPERLSRLSHRGFDLEAFRREAHRILQPALDDDDLCWLSVDPRSLLPTTHTLGGVSSEAKMRELVYEYTIEDFNQIPDMLRGRIAAGLREATEGHPERSATFRDVLDPEGVGDHCEECSSPMTAPAVEASPSSAAAGGTQAVVGSW